MPRAELLERLSFVLFLATWAPGLELLEEVVALVVDEDESGEVLDVYLPDGFHAEFGVFYAFDALDAAQLLGGGAGIQIWDWVCLTQAPGFLTTPL